MAAPDLLLVDAESLASGEVDRLRGLFDELQHQGVEVKLATAVLDRLDPEYVKGRSREGKSDDQLSVK